MNKKGFTLIELLAVIVILAIIALIATPAVLNIIEDSRKGAAEASARNIVSAAETYYMQGVMKGETPTSIDLTTDTLNYNGEKPEKGTLTYDASGRAYIKMYMNGYCVVVDVDNRVDAKKKDKDECKINAVILSIDAKGGEVSEASREYDSGDEIGELPTPVKEGYTFKGWTLTDGSSVTSITKITESMTVNATWEANTYTITLVDGDDNTTDQTMQVTYDSAYGNMTEPTKSGYIFIGWKLEDGTDITSESLVKTSSNHNVYAQWTAMCFVAGTKVYTEDGYKNIEDIKVGEKVYSYNLLENKLELKEVENTITSSADITYKMYVGNDILEMSERHQIYIVDKGWVRAYNIKIGDLMVDMDGNYVEITNIEKITHSSLIPTYNLTIKDNHNFYVSKTQILVHNANAEFVSSISPK